MNRKIYALVAAVALIASGGAAFGGEEWSGEGEVVEMGCYTRDNSKVGEGHAACAKTCLSKPDSKMGLLTADGEIINLAAGDNADAYTALIDLAGSQASVSGTLADGVLTVSASGPATG